MSDSNRGVVVCRSSTCFAVNGPPRSVAAQIGRGQRRCLTTPRGWPGTCLPNSTSNGSLHGFRLRASRSKIGAGEEGTSEGLISTLKLERSFSHGFRLLGANDADPSTVRDHKVTVLYTLAPDEGWFADSDDGEATFPAPRGTSSCPYQ